MTKWPQMIKFRWSLRTALVAYVIVPSAVALMGAGAMGLWVLEQQLERRLEEDVELVARAIQPALSRALEQERRNSIDQALQAAFSIDRVFGAYVYGSDGDAIASAGRKGSIPSGEVFRLAREGDRRGEFGEVAGREVYSYFVPLTDSGARIIGLLQVTRRASDFEEYIGTLRRQGALFTLLACGLVTGLLFYGHRGAIGWHLSEIASSMRKVEEGDRDHRSPVGGPEEIAELGSSLNAMLDSIQRAEEQIEGHREAEVELSRQLRQSEKLAAVGHLSAGVAHELGTPLSIIYGKVQRLLRRDLPGEVLKGLRVVLEEVRRTERIVQQLLDFGRGHQIRLRTIQVDHLVRSALSAIAAERDDLNVAIEGPMPGPMLRVDPFRLEQALTNLIRNAVQAAPAGRVSLSWSSRGSQVALAIEDDGPGIPPELRPHLFEPFFTTKKPGEGTGLGLAVAYRIVEEHGGRLEVEDSPMGGALFRMILPSPDRKEIPGIEGEESGRQ